jgi:putative transposase
MSSTRPNATETAGSVFDMPRPLRPEVLDGFFHVAQRGVNRCAIFRATQDRLLFVTLLEAAVQRFEWILFAYCLMTNHFHLLVTTPDPNVSAGMQYLNGRYCQWFNWRHGYEGHVVERRFFSDLVESDEQLLAVARYIVLNPVRAGLCRSASAWRWSSYRAMVSRRVSLPRISRWLLRLFGDELAEARERFAAFVRAGEAEAVP